MLFTQMNPNCFDLPRLLLGKQRTMKIIGNEGKPFYCQKSIKNVNIGNHIPISFISSTSTCHSAKSRDQVLQLVARVPFSNWFGNNI